MEKRTQLNIWYFILAVFAIVLIQDQWRKYQHVESIPYSEFRRFAGEGKIK